MKLDRELLRERLSRYSRRHIPRAELRPAAVLIPLFTRDGEDWVLLTRRTEELPHHRGEISFPGGARDPGDADIVATALRETEEEVGVDPRRVEVVGCLDDFVSIHGYHVQPVVGFFDAPGNYRANPAEIAELIELPLSGFLAPGVYHSENWRHRGRLHPVHFYRLGGHEVWGLTAAILRSFLALAAEES